MLRDGFCERLRVDPGAVILFVLLRRGKGNASALSEKGCWGVKEGGGDFCRLYICVGRGERRDSCAEKKARGDISGVSI